MPTKEINDGIDRAYMYDELIIKLLDTPEVQRTEHITNNGLCNKAFPGINYPRKTHLIGTAKRATQTYQVLKKNSNIPESYLLALQTLGVIHDTGHPPFAHALRNVIEKTLEKKHEEVSAQIVKGDLSFVEYFSKRPHLLGEENYIKEVLKTYENLPKVPEILDSYGVNSNLVVQVLCPELAKPLSLQNRFVRELIDGSLFDIDKMDYLPRDAKSANIEEGMVDPSRLLNGLKIVDIDNGRHLAVVDTSLDDLCSWVSARKYMYQNVYTHKTVLKYEAMLSEAVKRSTDYFKDNDIEIHLLTDERLLSLLTESSPVSARLIMDVEFGRSLKYSEAFSVKSRKVIEGNEHYDNLINITEFVKAQESKFPEDVIRDEIVKIAKIEPHEVIVYFPYEYKTEEQWKEKLDLYVYSHKEPSIVCSLKDMVEGKAPLQDIKANDVFYELCKPQTSIYFAVYSRPEHRDKVAKATEKFIKSISK